MTVYVIAFALSIGLYLLFSKRPNSKGEKHSKAVRGQSTGLAPKRAIFPFVISATPLVLVSGLRYNVGTDYFNTYYTGFYRLMAGSDFDQFEIGYKLLVKGIQVFTDNVFVLFFVTALITVGFTFGAFRRMSSNVAFSILLFMITRYYFIGMNGIRQMMALAIFSYSLTFAINRDLRSYLVFALLATSFHYSTVLLLPTYWLMQIDWSPKRTVAFMAIVGAFGSVAFPILARVLPAASKWGNILNTHNVAGNLFIFGTITLNLFILVVYYTLYRDHGDEGWYRCFLYLQVMAVATTFLLPSIPVIERVYWSFSFPSIICLPTILRCSKPAWWRMTSTALIVSVFTFYMVYDIGVLYDHQVVPYESIVGKEAVHSTEYAYRQTHGLDRWLR